MVDNVVPSWMTPEEREAFWEEVRTANIEARLARQRAELDALIAALPWWQRAILRLILAVRFGR